MTALTAFFNRTQITCLAFVSFKCAVFLLHMLQTHRAVHRLIEANFSLDGGQLQFSSILSGNGLGTLVSVHVVREPAIRMNRCNESLGDVIRFFQTNVTNKLFTVFNFYLQ